MAHSAIRRGKNRPLPSERRYEPALQWQSWLLSAGVLSLCGAAAIWWLFHNWGSGSQGALLISAAFALVAWAARAGTPRAALAGGLLAATMLLASADGAHWLRSALPSLLAMILLTYFATRFGHRSKAELGAAESRRGRNAAQVTANLGVAGLAGAAALAIRQANPGLIASSLASWPSHSSPRWAAVCAAMLTAALAEAAADTLSSEIGQVLGESPLLVTTRSCVAPGTDGGMSLPGTVAGVTGAIVVVLVAAPTLRLSLRAGAACAVGAIAGMFFDSLLGATAERKGLLNNDAVNFLSTLAAALLAVLFLLV